ncbi:LytTR family DNA-binding domain-containing protein [Chryseobacterium sp. NRRL B-14859]|uniref:LytR/AlgR family response regulator transcription factor n=1 Tax=Chryseobacterium sp. NRRL B-14859 TaxID=1562763 RepID=UPI0033984EA8
MKNPIVEDQNKEVQSLDNIISKLQFSNMIKSEFENMKEVNSYLSENKFQDFICVDFEDSTEINCELIRELSSKCHFLIISQGKNGIQSKKAPKYRIYNKPAFPEKLVKQNSSATDFNSVLGSSKKIELNTKESFLVYKGNKYVTVKTGEIAYFYINYKIPSIVTFKGEEFTINYSLDRLESLVSNKCFFRLNRQYLVNFNAVKEVEHYFGRKLYVKLIINTPEKLLIGKEKSSYFLKWLEER